MTDYSLLCTPGLGCLVRGCGTDCGVCELMALKSTKGFRFVLLIAQTHCNDQSYL